MALLGYNCNKQYKITTSFLNYFRNVMKLKNPIIDSNNRLHSLTLPQNFIETCSYNTFNNVKSNSLCNTNFFKISLIQSSRWTRCSKTGYFMNTYAKKKNKRSQFEENLKAQTNKLRETKRRFKKTIVDIVCQCFYYYYYLRGI